MLDAIPLICGIILVLLVLLQLGLSVTHSVRRFGNDAIIERLALKEWKQRLKAAQLRVQQAEDEQVRWAGWRKFEVRRKNFENESKDICSLYLYPHDRRTLPPFKPGQFLMLRTEIPDPGDPMQSSAETRCYSLSDSYNPRYFRISVKACPPPDGANVPPGIVSNFLHERIREGDLIDVMAPSGEFVLDTDSNAPVVLIAGGVGITPILSMLNSIVDRGIKRETWLFYGVRGAKDLVMMQAMRHAVDNMPNLHIVICVSGAPIGDVEEIHGADNSSVRFHHGRVTIALLKRYLPSNNYAYFLCGPEGMALGLREQLAAWGVPRKDIRYELFAPPVEDADVPNEVAEDIGRSFQVKFGLTEKALTWTGERNLFLLTKKHNLVVKRIHYGCRQGKCGSCHTAIRSGAVSYPRTQPTFSVQEGYCLPCICVPAANLELEA